MKTFIRVVELWVPDRTRTRLEFGGCLASEEYSEFKAVSENALFAYDEGLPGKAWASGHPVILTEFSNSYFKRTDEAIEAGLTCGVALPVFAGEFPDGRDGAVLRRRRKARRRRRALAQRSREVPRDGPGRRLLRHRRHVRIQFTAHEIPARVWPPWPGLEGRHAPDHNAKSFLRWEEASEIGINCGVGIPYTTSADHTWVVTFLSAQATPIARRFEIWVPNASRTELVFQSGDCSKNTDLTSLYASKTIRKGEGSIGGAWATGMPAINEHLKVDASIASQAARAAGMNQIVVLPVIESAFLKAVLAWYL